MLVVFIRCAWLRRGVLWARHHANVTVSKQCKEQLFSLMGSSVRVCVCVCVCVCVTSSRNTSSMVAVLQEAFLFTSARALTLGRKCQSKAQTRSCLLCTRHFKLFWLGCIELNMLGMIFTRLSVVSVVILTSPSSCVRWWCAFPFCD